jgi:hypothetical protein
LCSGTELRMRSELLRSEVLPQALLWPVPSSLLPQVVLRSRLRAELLRGRAELWLCAQLLRPEVLPSQVPASLLPS